MYAQEESPEEVLNFWFGTLNTPEDYPADHAKLWFNGGPQFDQEITDRFGDLFAKAKRHELDDWKNSSKGRLALIILLDQFPRNMFRGSPEAFSCDCTARELSLKGIELEQDTSLFPIERVFFYLPLEHAENVFVQELSIDKFDELTKEAPVNLQPHLESYYKYAYRHYEIIAKFGRFPHRNQVLGRESTINEIKFLNEQNSSF